MLFTTRVDIPVEYNGELFIQHQPDEDDRSKDEFALGFAKFSGVISRFEYEWPLEFLNRTDVVAIRDALNHILAISDPEV